MDTTVGRVARCQRVSTDDDHVTWTVIDDTGRIVEPIEEFLEFGRQSAFSANTIRSYATALALWIRHLHERGQDWDSIDVRELGRFADAVRHGMVGELATQAPRGVSEATVAARIRPVVSFYRFHQAVGRSSGAASMVDRLPVRPGQRFLPFLTHVQRRHGRDQSVLRVRVAPREAPIVAPGEVQALLDVEASFDSTAGTWSGDLRYRLLWLLLLETGLRLGEALSLQHRDWQSGRGSTAAVQIVPRPHPYGLVPKSGGRRVFIGSKLDQLYSDYVWWLCELGADVAVEDWDGAYVFCNVRRPPLFKPLRPESVYAHLAAVKRRQTPVPPAMTPHWFRHTHATALLLAGTPLHVVSRRLGHRSVQTTMSTYAHVTADAELAALSDWSRVVQGWGVHHG